MLLADINMLLMLVTRDISNFRMDYSSWMEDRLTVLVKNKYLKQGLVVNEDRSNRTSHIFSFPDGNVEEFLTEYFLIFLNHDISVMLLSPFPDSNKKGLVLISKEPLPEELTSILKYFFFDLLVSIISNINHQYFNVKERNVENKKLVTSILKMCEDLMIKYTELFYVNKRLLP